MLKRKSFFIFLFLFITLLAIEMRYIGKDFLFEDMENAFIPWFKTMKEGGGLPALGRQVGDYSLIYQTMVAFLTYIDANPVYIFKTVSGIFDFLIALSLAYFTCNCSIESVLIDTDKQKKFCVTYACVLFLPTVIMNSAFLGQCDAVYSFFLLWSVWLLYNKKYRLSFFLLGWSLAFKLQAVLLFPLFIYFSFAHKKLSILLNFLVTVFVFYFSGIVVFFYRHNLFDGTSVYAKQTVMFKHMYMNSPSFWVFIGNDYNKLYLFAIGLTFFILGIGLFLVIFKIGKINSYERFFGLAVFVAWTCVIFLPAMHERYTYALDLFLLMLACYSKKYTAYALIAAVTSCTAYIGYMFTDKALSQWIIFIYIIAWFCFSYYLFNSEKSSGLSNEIK